MTVDKRPENRAIINSEIMAIIQEFMEFFDVWGVGALGPPASVRPLAHCGAAAGLAGSDPPALLHWGGRQRGNSAVAPPRLLRGMLDPPPPLLPAATVWKASPALACGKAAAPNFQPVSAAQRAPWEEPLPYRRRPRSVPSQALGERVTERWPGVRKGRGRPWQHWHRSPGRIQASSGTGGMAGRCGSWKYILGGVLGAAAVLTAGLLLGHYAIPKAPGPAEWVHSLSRDLDPALLEDFMAQVEASRIRENLKTLSSKPHMATTKGDEELVQLLLSRWRDPGFGLDQATEARYDVFLSFPDPEKPNSVAVVLPNGTRAFVSRESEEPLRPDQADKDVVKPYAAYAPPGNPKGRLVYANQGKMSDYQELLKQNITLNGTIAITRYGGAGRAAKAINGAHFGVIGVVVYTDPMDINDGKASPEDTYPHSWYMPPSGVERGSYNSHFGDLLTPYYPAKDFTYRIPEGDIPGIPPIPTQPIGFEDARTLICNLAGPKAADSWQGALGCPYHLGPGFRQNGSFPAQSDVQVSVHNQRRINASSNVMGLIRGSVEPDRYVLYGNHRDSWVHGAIDPSSGTAVMLEVTRVLGKMVKEGKWRPRRSIIFGSWGAEEFGLIGSTEYTEEFYSKLQERSVAYINVDIAVFANATLRVQATPPAQSVIFAATQQVKTPADQSVTVYENWKRHFNRSSPAYGVIPSLGSLGAGSDFAAFIHYLGITSMDIAYTYDRSKTSARIYPAYHTAFDTFDYAENFIDPGFTSHQTVARTAGNVLLRLADALVLPLNPSDYGETLQQMCSAAEQAFQAELASQNISLVPLKNAVDRFQAAAAGLNQRVENLRKEESPSPLQVRAVNDQLMLLERAFLNPRAFPDKYYYSHTLLAPKSSAVATFPGLADAVEGARQLGQWGRVWEHLTIAVQAIENAASTLEPVAE
ncbi:aminopeptidase NAALADL1 [Varanus komodoensis]|uniref:aminopeptidase NAALADL1 n=1 Tax=Varanus komodoensis TaxID=61221 RepID=UPI001CF7E1BB|nr:aminopeptidase NAALADL1 [Varanus komodoensis]